MSWSRQHNKLILAVAAVIAVATLRHSLAPGIGWDFRNNLWAPASLLVSGRSPYDLSPVPNTGGAVWMPQIIGVFFPLGWLTNEQADALWFGLTIVALIAVIWLTAETDQPSPFRLAIAVLVTGLFPPLLSHVRLGQATVFITLIYIIATRSNTRWWTPALVALALTKPQLGVLVTPGLLIARWQDDGNSAAVRFVVLIAASTAVMTIPLFVADPAWAADFLAAQQRNPTWAHPSIMRATGLAFGQTAGLVLWALIALTLFSVNSLLWLRLRRERAIIWSLALTPLVTPYVWSWDFVMLVPLMSWLIFHLPLVRLVALLIGYSVVWYRNVTLALSGDVSNEQYWWIPPLLLSLFVATLKAGRWREIVHPQEEARSPEHRSV